MARLGNGRRTRQYNQGAKSLRAYVEAARSHTRGRHDAGGKIIHETPKAKRSEYARQIWAARRRFNPQKPYAVIYRATGETLSEHLTRGEAEKAADRAPSSIRRYVGVEYTGRWKNPIYAGNPEVVRISGIEYEVLGRTTVAEHEAQGRPHLAREMRKVKIAAGLTIARPRGDQTFQVYEYENGGFGKPFAMTGVSARGFRRESQENPSITAIYHPEDGRYGVYESLPGDVYHRFLGEYVKRKHGLAKFGRGVGPQTISSRGVLFTDLKGKGLAAANPLLEAILGGAAAGAAVIGSQHAIKKLQERKGKGMWPFRRSNQNNGKAAQLYQEFHGREPSEVLTFSEALMAEGTYVALGDDPEIWLRPVPGRNPDKSAPCLC